MVLCLKWTPENCVYDPTIVSGIPEEVKVYAVEIETKSNPGWKYAKNLVHRGLFPHLFPIDFYCSALRVIPKIIAEHRIDIIWGTAPMMCNLAIANLGSKRNSIPWVADFRDVSQFKENFVRNIFRKVRIFHERQILKSASAVTTVSKGFAETLKERHRREVSVIFNGFDTEFTTGEEIREIKEFNIVYTGGVNIGKPNFRPLLDACQLLIESGEMDEKDIIIQFFGANNKASLQKMFANHQYSHLVQMNDHVFREKCFELQKQAAILLLATYPGTGVMTSKIYEYLAAQRPILAIPCDGDGIDDLLKETKAGVSCSKKEEIAEHLLKWYKEWKASGTISYKGNIQMKSRFSRREQAGQLAQIMDEISND